jgi:hypothetical protein
MSSRVPPEILSGTIRSEALPQELDLSELAADMERLWQASVAEWAAGVVVEYAATIVLDEEGALKLVNEVRGLPYDVEPNLQVSEGLTFIGTFHTHPRTNGLLPMPLSDSDVVCAVRYGERLSVLRSAETIWVLVKTAETVADVNQLDLQDRFFAAYRAALARQLSVLAAYMDANLALCDMCQFALYQGGADGLLKEVFRP